MLIILRLLCLRKDMYIYGKENTSRAASWSERMRMRIAKKKNIKK